VNDEKNSRLYQEYVALSKQLPNVITTAAATSEIDMFFIFTIV